MMVSMTTPPTPPSGHLARIERLALCDTFDEVGPDAPTLCDPWLTRDLAAHLVVRERRPDLAAGIVLPFLAGRLERGQAALAGRTPWPELVDLVRTGPPVWSPTRVGALDDLVNTMEMVIHHEDVLRGDGARGPRRTLDARLEKAVWATLRRLASSMFRRANMGVVLVAPGHQPVTARPGDPAVTLNGDPLELLLTAYGRERVAEVAYDGDPDLITALQATRLGL